MYKRQCPECGNNIRYSEKDKFMVCKECGFSKQNPHYKKSGFPTWAIVTISIVCVLALAVGGFFVIPFDMDKTKAAETVSTALSRFGRYQYSAYTMEAEYSSSTVLGAKEEVAFSYKDGGDMYVRMVTYSKNNNSTASKTELYTYVDKKEMMVYFYQRNANTIDAYKKKITESDYNNLFKTLKNQAMSEEWDFGEVEIAPKMIESAKKKGFDTIVKMYVGSAEIEITVFFKNYIKEIKMPGISLKADLKFKKFKFDKSIFEDTAEHDMYFDEY